MKVTVIRENLSRGLSVVSGAAPSHSTLPVLSNVLLATDGGRLKIQATDLETAITCWVGAKVEDEGAITVPAKTLTQFVSSLPAVPIDLILNERIMTLAVKCAGFDAKIKGIAITEYPIFTPVEGQVVTIDAQLFRSLCEQVHYACETGYSRPVLTGVLLEISAAGIAAAACDGHRLATCSSAVSGLPDLNISTIVPANVVRELLKVTKATAGEMRVTFPAEEGQQRVVFAAGDVEVIAQLIAGTYPDYRSLIPQAHKTCATLNVADLLSVVRASSAFVNEQRFRLQIDPASQHVVTSGETSSIGSITNELSAQIEGEPVSLCLNAQYLREALSAIQSESVSVKCNDSSSPVVLEPAGSSGAKHLIMPMSGPGAAQ